MARARKKQRERMSLSGAPMPKRRRRNSRPYHSTDDLSARKRTYRRIGPALPLVAISVAALANRTSAAIRVVHRGIPAEASRAAKFAPATPAASRNAGIWSKLNWRSRWRARNMAIRVAINGFGRIGRLVMRAAMEHASKELDIVGINDLGSVETNAHLLRYDSVHGRFAGEVTTGEDWMDAGQGKIRVTAERDPAKLPWKELGVDVALECTGIFTKREAAAKHLEAGAKKVIISAPADGVDFTVVMGVNHDELSAEHEVISNASCTTNCLAPVAYVLHQGIGIDRGYMTTIHAYTGDQSLQHTLHSALRRARAAALSLIPTSTGAARAVGLVLPALKGKLDGTAIRVPTANVSPIDPTFDSAPQP